MSKRSRNKANAMRIAIPVMKWILAVDFDDFKQVSIIDTVNQEIRQQ